MTIAVETSGRLPLSADASKLRQVVWNLARNACEAAATGGGHVAMRATGTDDAIEVVIEDDGPGIAAEHLPHIFDPFYTTKRTGTGLGLATCHAIIEEHGGIIEVSSRVGHGTRFVVRVPRSS